jgi:hypothetical protein
MDGSMADKRWDNSKLAWLLTEKKWLHGMMATKTRNMTAEDIIITWHHLQAHEFHWGLDELHPSSVSFGIVVQIEWIVG